MTRRSTRPFPPELSHRGAGPIKGLRPPVGCAFFSAMPPADPSPTPPASEPLTEEEFNHRIATDPAFLALVRAAYVEALAVPPTPATEHCYPGMRAALAGLDTHAARLRVSRQLVAMHGLARRVFEEEVLAELPVLSAQVDALVDEVLSLEEPDRSEVMETVLPWQTHVRKLEAAVRAGGR